MAGTEAVVDVADLARLARSSGSKERVILEEIGPNHATSGAPARYSARRINLLLDHLEYAFPEWSSCDRYGQDLVMMKR